MSDTLNMIPASQAAENLREMQIAMRLDFTTAQLVEFNARFTGFLSNYVPREVWSKCVASTSHALSCANCGGLYHSAECIVFCGKDDSL